MSTTEPVRGVVDRFEGDYAVVVLDDGQQLDWPRSALPHDIRPGTSVVLSLGPRSEGTVRGALADTEGDELPPEGGDAWAGELTTGPEGWIVRLSDGQSLRWPAGVGMLAPSDNHIVLQLVADAEDTEARRRRVADLIDDIFGNETTS